MITVVCFDVRGATAASIQEAALATLARFNGGTINLDRWTIQIDVHEEAVAGTGEVALWRGEVTAKRHDSPR